MNAPIRVKLSDRIQQAIDSLQELLSQGVSEHWVEEDLCHTINHLAMTRDELREQGR